jgi:CheY-like chemotaxis protein
MKADELIQSRRVLLVDDEPYILEGLSRQVGDQFDVTTAGSGSEALALLRSGLRFAVIVADMRMPGMDGVEFLVHARAIDPTAIRMMLTGNNDRQTAIGCA